MAQDGGSAAKSVIRNIIWEAYSRVKLVKATVSEQGYMQDILI